MRISSIKIKILLVGLAFLLHMQSFTQIAQTTTKRETDPFMPYLDHVPTLVKVLTTDTLEAPENGTSIILQRIIFHSRNDQNQVYALLARPLARPAEAGQLPGLLCLHGGGSKAEDLRSLVKQYAAHGYVALAPDLPGICNSLKVPFSSGPWKTKPGGEAPRFAIADSIGNSTLVDAEVAGLEAFNLLKAQPQVDPGKIGITGFSWGGYSTTFLSGLLGSRVKAAYAVFGCGFYDAGSFWTDIIRKMPEGQRRRWLTFLDAGRRAKNIKASYFIESATNDTYFWPEAVTATLGQIKYTKNHVWNSNLNHRQGPDGAEMQRMYFDYYLKEKGRPFGSVHINSVRKLKDGAKKITASLQLPSTVSLETIRLYYGLRNTDWQHRTWQELPMTRAGAYRHSGEQPQYTVDIPANIAGQKINFYVWAKDNRKVVISSQMY